MTTEQEALDLYLAEAAVPLGNGWIRQPCLQAALRDAREASGRHPETRDELNAGRAGNWLSAIGYLLILDQLGTAVRPAAETAPPAGSAILRCLVRFTQLVERERQAIYALRCALAHDFALFNKSRDPHLQHEFALHRGRDTLIRLPKQPWNGDYHRLPSDPTVISLPLLADRIEYIVLQVRHMHGIGAISIESGLTPDELLQRYTFVYQA